MSIPFTQYLRPDGRKAPVLIDMPPEIETLAHEFIAAGGWFECEHLATGHASLTACAVTGGEPGDIAIEVVPNGPQVVEATERLVRRAFALARQQKPPV